MVVRDGADQIAFHDLHVVDVIQQLDAGRVDRLHDRDAERRPVALVVGVVHLAVQELHANRHAVVLADLLHAIQPRDAVGNGLLVAHPALVAEEGDDVRHLHGGGAGDGSLEVPDDRVMVGLDVEAVLDRAAACIAHRAHEPGLARDRPLVFREQIDRRQSQIGDRPAELRQRDLRIRPPRHRLLQPAVLDDAVRGRRRRSRGAHQRGGRQGGCRHEGSPRDHCFAPGTSHPITTYVAGV